MPIYDLYCQSCGFQKEEMMKYEDMKAGVSCECGGNMKNRISAPMMIKDFGSGPQRRAMAPDVGPLSKQSRAYEKKRDDENSHFYKPGSDLSMTSAQRKRFKSTTKGLEEGKTNFAKKQ